ncbi:MAG TPA: hypothetical protein VF902_03680, partial [Coriobacteriia bacterium]
MTPALRAITTLAVALGLVLAVPGSAVATDTVTTIAATGTTTVRSTAPVAVGDMEAQLWPGEAEGAMIL